MSLRQCVSDVRMWTPAGDQVVLAMGMLNIIHKAVLIVQWPPGLLNCIRALGGYTLSHSAESVFDTDTFKESEYLAHIHSTSGNVLLALNWYVLSIIGFAQLNTVSQV
jgi:hypothetical protein